MNKYILIKNFMPVNSGIENSIVDLVDKFQDSKVGKGVNEKADSSTKCNDDQPQEGG